MSSTTDTQRAPTDEAPAEGPATQTATHGDDGHESGGPPRLGVARFLVPALLLGLAIAVAITISTGTDGSAGEQGIVSGLADGWFQPDADTAVVAAAGAAEVPLEQGPTAGHADGWFTPPTSATSAPDEPIRQGTTPGMPDGWFQPGSTVVASTTTVPVGRVR